MGKSVHLAATTCKPSFLTRGTSTRKSLSTLSLAFRSGGRGEGGEGKGGTEGDTR